MVNYAGNCAEQDKRSAKEILDDFNDMMEMLKPYLPKIPKYKPAPKVEWKKDNPFIYPKSPRNPTGL